MLDAAGGASIILSQGGAQEVVSSCRCWEGLTTQENKEKQNQNKFRR